MKLTKKEIELIKKSQCSMRENPENCPFSYKYFDTKIFCALCHKWIGTVNNITLHPCDLIDKAEVKRRYWRNPENGTT